MSSNFIDAQIRRHREIGTDIESAPIFAGNVEKETKSDDTEKVKEDVDRKSLKDSSFPQRGGGLKHSVWRDRATMVEKKTASIDNRLSTYSPSALSEASST
jgi:hypothetical protein